MITIRSARPQDAAAIRLLNLEGLGYDYPLERTRERLEDLTHREDHCLLVAELDPDTVAGYIHLAGYDTLYFDHMANVLGLAVFTELRRRGIATKLLTAGEQWARENGATGVRLNSGESRTGAHAFYERMGYTCGKLQKRFQKEF